MCVEDETELKKHTHEKNGMEKSRTQWDEFLYHWVGYTLFSAG